MYFRRHCYDKAHRCPGRRGGGFKFPRHPKGTPEPDWYRELREEDPSREPWEQSNHIQQHWWQQKERCDHGLIYMPADDPWRNWRFHRCNRCDVIALPIVVHWLDPKWVYYEIKHFFQYGAWHDLLWHKRQWVNDDAPWWSLPDTAWRLVRSKGYAYGDWFGRLYRWYRYPSQRDADGWREEWLAAGK